MSDITEISDPEEVEAAWRRVFLSNDAFSWSFREEAWAGRVFYPTDGYALTAEQYRQLVSAVRAAGEQEFLLSVVESEALTFLERSWGHYRCRVGTPYDEYRDLNLTLENALYSARGTWGVLISHEEHALLAGIAEIIAALDRMHESWQDDIRRLRAMWEGNENAGWVEPVADRVISQLP